MAVAAVAAPGLNETAAREVLSLRGFESVALALGSGGKKSALAASVRPGPTSVMRYR